MEYKFDTNQKGQPRPKEEFTPAKRYSFLVGEHENSHTAQSSLLPILENTDNDPSLIVLEGAFSIESVTREFFEKYRELFLEIKESLDKIVQKDKAIKADFDEKGVDTVDFSKKLLGQIVFLYFLQKKGWFGVQRKSAWGTGSKIFLRELFRKKHTNYQNYFNDILEPLFYEALANGERKDDYYRLFDCYIPFLNGGLFDPLNNYDWVHTDILIPNELFSNQIKTKQGDIGTGILDVFDRYNFTVKEDEPLEKEVAIDPEMLGKVFENLLEVKDRKSKGTYYTPREIVHYMCQESLINYLATELKDQVQREDIETLIKHGEEIIDHEQQVIRAGKETTRYPYRLSSSIRDNSDLIDSKLAEIKVCDPAVGSGAFLVGMMSEIVRTRSVLSRLKNPDEEPSIYDFKRDAIQDSLHGVDIDLGAVEIAKLRLWLSLIVDEDNYKHIKPLPNLDYKIMQGNSLLEEYEGIKLIDERFFEKYEEKELAQKRFKEQQDKLSREYMNLHKGNNLTSAKKAQIIKRLKEIENQLKALDNPKRNGQGELGFYGERETRSKANKLLELHERFFNEHRKSEKDHIHTSIDELTWDLIETTLKQKGKEDKLEEVKKFQRTNTNPFFLWKLNFADVFRENNGFDILIANPPYLRIQEIQKSDPQMASDLKAKFISAAGSFDIYVCFVEQAIKLNNKTGNVAFILPHKFFQATFGKNIRQLISSTKMLRKIVDFGSSQVFETATTYTCLLFLSHHNDTLEFAELKPNTIARDLSSVLDFIDTNKQGESDKVATTVISNSQVSETEWHFSAGRSGEILSKLQTRPRRLSDICEKMFQGIATSADSIYFLEHIASDDNVVTAYSKSLDKEIRIEKGFVKPLLKGADVHRYMKLTPKIWCVFPYKIENGKAILYDQNEIKKLFPLAWRYLLENKKELENREHGRMKNKRFYAYIYPKNLTEFDREKIVTPDIASGCQMSLDDVGLYHTTTIYSFVFKEDCTEAIEYYLAVLNSKLLWYFVTLTGSVLRGNFFRFKTNYLMPFPIPAKLSENDQGPFISRVKTILATTKSDDYTENAAKQAKVKELEKQIDSMVYDLYGLTPEEIAIVEGDKGR